jgi:hypothetical protein
LTLKTWNDIRNGLICLSVTIWPVVKVIIGNIYKFKEKKMMDEIFDDDLDVEFDEFGDPMWVDTEFTPDEMYRIENGTYFDYVPVKYGDCSQRLYNIWCTMIARCHSCNSKDYHNYGAKGIYVCDVWRNDFLEFHKWAMTHGYDDSLTIDRINGLGPYEPCNCRWASQKVQQNNRSTNALYTIDGVTHTMKEWCDIKGLNYPRVKKRRQAGWPVERLFAPDSKRNSPEAIAMGIHTRYGR